MQSRFSYHADVKQPQRSSRQQQRTQFLPEILLPQQFKSLQEIVQSSRVPDNKISVRSSILDQLLEPQTSRSDYHSIIKDKKLSLNSNAKPEYRKGLLVRFEESGVSTQDSSQPKSILKRKNSNSSQHSDIFDFFELVEQPQLTRNSKHVTLKPLQQTSISPNMADTVTPKKVSFNRQIQVKLIEQNDYVMENIEQRHRHGLRRQMTDIIN